MDSAECGVTNFNIIITSHMCHKSQFTLLYYLEDLNCSRLFRTCLNGHFAEYPSPCILYLNMFIPGDVRSDSDLLH